MRYRNDKLKPKYKVSIKNDQIKVVISQYQFYWKSKICNSTEVKWAEF